MSDLESALRTPRSVALAVREALRVGLDRVVPQETSVPLRASEITPDWLCSALLLPPGSVHEVRLVDENSGTAARAQLEVATSVAGLPRRFFVKLPPRNYFQHVLMNVFHLGTHEVVAYRALGADPPVRVPRCHLARTDARDRCVLVLEDLSGTATFRTVLDTATPAEAEAVVDALADLHIAFWDSARFRGDLAPLAVRSPADIALADLVRRLLLTKIGGHIADAVPASMREQCRIFFERSAEIDAFWAAQPQTLIHGDPHLGNLFFEGAQPGLLDWQVASRGAGIRDVAYFATSSVAPEVLRTIERGLVDRYTARLGAAGLDVDPDRMWTRYRAAITEWFLAAVCTAQAGARMQSLEVSRAGVERAVAAVATHDSFATLAALIDGRIE